MTSTDRNKTGPNKGPRRVAAGKKLAEYKKRVREEKRKKGGSQQSEDPKDPGPEGENCGATGLQPAYCSLLRSRCLVS